MDRRPGLRELADPLRALWLLVGVGSGWLLIAYPSAHSIWICAVTLVTGLLLSKSTGSRLAVLAGFLLQQAGAMRWEGSPAPRDFEGIWRVVVERETAPGKGECRILSGPAISLEGRRARCSGGRAGDTLAGIGVLRGLRDPTNPGGFDARSWGAFAGLEGFLVWTDDGSVSSKAGMASMAERSRRWIESVVAGTLHRRLEPASAALWTATLLAKNDELPTNALEAFRQSGLFHMLSVSGFHMAVLGGGLVLLLSLARVPRRSSWILAALVVIGYAWLLRFPPPVSRSAVAFAVLALAMATGRRPHAKNALFLAAAAVLCLDPNIPFQMGAQLTFVATASLLWVGPALVRLFPLRMRQGRWNDWVLSPLCASLAATFATAPVLAWHVGAVAWIGIPAGLVSAAAFSVGFLSALATALMGWLPAWCSWGFAGAAEGCARLVYEVALRSGQWRPGSIITGRPEPFVVAGSLVVLVLFALSTRPRTAAKAWIAMAVVGLAAAAGATRQKPPRLRCVFLDVGQGNATLVTWPSGRTWLVDAGPTSRYGTGRDAGRDAILPAMRILGIDRLDAVAVSHADLDHYGGLGWLSHRVPPSDLLLSSDSGIPSSSGFDSLRTSLVDRGWKVRRIGYGQKLSYGDGARCEVVAPGFGAAVPRNQASLVLRFGFDTARALIAGDADSVSEAYQILSGAALRSQVLLVGHHGSRHSSSQDWLGLAKPEHAVLSYGRTNRYGHPHQEVLEKLAKVGARPWRTPEGAVVVELSGQGVEVHGPGSRWWNGPWRARDLSLVVPWISNRP